MDGNDRRDPQEQGAEKEPAADKRSTWQRNKEELYDKVPLTLRQLDIIIALGLFGLAVVTLLIVLEATGVIG